MDFAVKLTCPRAAICAPVTHSAERGSASKVTIISGVVAVIEYRRTDIGIYGDVAVVDRHLLLPATAIVCPVSKTATRNGVNSADGGAAVGPPDRRRGAIAVEGHDTICAATSKDVAKGCSCGCEVAVTRV